MSRNRLKTRPGARWSQLRQEVLPEHGPPLPSVASCAVWGSHQFRDVETHQCGPGGQRFMKKTGLRGSDDFQKSFLGNNIFLSAVKSVKDVGGK